MYVLYVCLYIGILHKIHFDAHFHPKIIIVTCYECKETARVMPLFVLSDVTTGHPERAARICIFQKVNWQSGIA